ncbi:hypothetical protein [Deinococcus cellulosilyticus]|uniref:Uncharacterized protein n=1 Tax=Deinococcus cellulosilyticus (strain DSM 18568 / NBRC 106333 / KACC 11606 / 5516J-15) TaxID=1223518 RepID=A0A511MX10_DEIC1|nr:hypothetical protein [Deinococcus cellulosilyticus]GEM44808.1 hypothetical protein DC3_04430 [Deinococcus cellulosilyticus NBRC 106333 = KACC 11606]
MTGTPEPRIPIIRVDYQAGIFFNTMTGEVLQEISGAIMLEFQKNWVLWPEWTGRASMPMCVDGSDTTRGKCEDCKLRQWHLETPPRCSEELSVVLQTGNMLVLLVARRGMSRPLEQWIEMQNIMGNPLHGQELTLRLIKDYRNPNAELHRISVLPGRFLTREELEGNVKLRTQGNPLDSGLKSVQEQAPSEA